MRKQWSHWGLPIVLLMIPSLAWAQVGRDAGDEPEAKPRAAKPTDAKPLAKILDELEKAVMEEIDLDDKQQEEVEDLFQDIREDMKPQNAKAAEENAKRLAELDEELQKARDEKDWNTFRELNKERQKIMGSQPNAVAIMRQVHDELAKTVDKDQVAKLDEILERFRGDYEQKFQDGMFKLMGFLRALDQIKPDNDQAKEFKDFRTSFLKEMKDLDKSDTAGMERMYAEQREALFKILTDEQIQAFEKAEADALNSMKDHKRMEPGNVRKPGAPRSAKPEHKGGDTKVKPTPTDDPQPSDSDADDDEDADEEDDE